jgi:hypothetical protein
MIVPAVGEKATQETAGEYCERMCDICKSSRSSQAKEVLADPSSVATQRPSLCLEAEREVIDQRLPSIDLGDEDDLDNLGGYEDLDDGLDDDQEDLGPPQPAQSRVASKEVPRTVPVVPDDVDQRAETERSTWGLVVTLDDRARRDSVEVSRSDRTPPSSGHSKGGGEQPTTILGDDTRAPERGRGVQSDLRHEGPDGRVPPKRRKSVRSNPWSDDEGGAKAPSPKRHTAPLSCD